MGCVEELYTYNVPMEVLLKQAMNIGRKQV